MFLVLNLAIWGIIVYSLRIAIAGRPIMSLLATSPRPLLEQVAHALDPETQDQDWGDEVNEFLTKLARFSLFASILLIIEYMLCIYFLSLPYRDYFAWFLVVKNIFFLILSVHFHRQSIESNPIHALMKIPAWAVRWERIGCFAGAVCLLVQLLKVNKLI